MILVVAQAVQALPLMYIINQNEPVITITKENYTNEVLESDLPVVLDAYATWCGPCKAMAPIFSELSLEMASTIKFAKFDVDQQKEMAKQLNIQGMPTLIFYKNGKEIGRHTGMLDKKALREKLLKTF